MNDAMFDYVLALYLQYNPGGGVIFPILDKGQLSDFNIEYCLNEADKDRDVMAVFICNAFLKKDEAARRKIWKNLWRNNHVER